MRPIINCYGDSGPPLSPRLSPLDVHVCSCVKNVVHEPKLDTRDELVDRGTRRRWPNKSQTEHDPTCHNM